MLRSLKDLESYKVNAVDGDIGSVINFLLDDERWIIRYLVVQTGGPLFLDGRQVLITPISFGSADWSTRRFNLMLTMEKVKNSPGIDLHQPVSRRRELEYFHYYGYSHYWGAMGVWGMGDFPAMLASGGKNEAFLTDSDVSSDDVHLRSDEEVRGYHIEGSDEAIGHVADFIVDDQTWEVRYLVIDTSNWWFGKKVLVAPQWANRISWEEKKVYLNMSRWAIQNSPEWDPVGEVDREYEARLHDHYGRPKYWVDGK